MTARIIYLPTAKAETLSDQVYCAVRDNPDLRGLIYNKLLIAYTALNELPFIPMCDDGAQQLFDALEMMDGLEHEPS